MFEGIADVNDSEVDVTPEMIEAGLKAMYEYDSRFEPYDNMVHDIFRAMTAVRVE